MSYRYNQRGERVKERSSGSAIGWGIFSLFVLFGLWMIAPWGPIHAAVLLIFKSWPLLMTLFVSAVVVVLLAGWRKSSAIAIGGGMLLAIILMVGSIFSSALSDAKLAQSQQVTNITTLPDTQSVRWTAMAIAKKMAQNANQDPTSAPLADGIDPFTTEQGDVSWIAALVPSGVINAFLSTQKGVMVVTDSDDPKPLHSQFICGEGMLVTDEVTWAIWKQHYLTDLGEPYYFQSPVGNELLMLVPYINWKLDFPVTVPEWGGVMVVHGDCQIEKLTSAQALADERLVGARLVPEEFAKMVGSAWQYRLGIWNAWIGPHTDQTEIPWIDGESNQMPYLLPTEDGPAWFFGMEPFGPSYALYKIMLIDAVDARVRVHSFETNTSVMSPNKAAGYITGEVQNFIWTEKDGSQGMILIEPRPIIRQGILYWMLTQTTNEFATVNSTFLLRTTDRAILVAENIEDMNSFMAGGSLRQILKMSASSATPSAVDGAPVNANADLTQLTEQQLRELINAIFDELSRR